MTISHFRQALDAMGEVRGILRGDAPPHGDAEENLTAAFAAVGIEVPGDA